MDAADHNEGVTEQAIRYIITRPCLAEGSLRLLKYLQPLFPADGPVQLQDGRGEVFTVTVDAPNGRLSGVGELYRSHNLGVNDVLHLRRTEERRFLVECVVKPHARSQASSAERPVPAPVVTEKRVVIHATPHVREVRMERVTLTAAGRSASAPAHAATEPVRLQPDRIQVEQPRSVERHAVPGQSIVGQAVAGRSDEDVQAGTVIQAGTGIRAGTQKTTPGSQVGEGQGSGGPAAQSPASQAPGDAGRPPQVRAVTVQAIQGRAGAGQRTTPTSRPAASIGALTARMQQAPTPTRFPVGLNAPIQINFPAPNTVAPGVMAPGVMAPLPLPAAPTPGATPSAVTQTALAEPAPVSAPVDAPTPGPGSGPVFKATATRPQLLLIQPAETSNAQPSSAQPHPSGQHNPEDQLTALARLTGYTCEHLGNGVVRLQAELGQQSYSVLIATTPQALTTPAWSESCDYMALLTPEDQRPQGIPRFTYAALEALLEHARLAPLTPIDLRGYWNTGSFDQESVESVAELVSAHLAQRGSFSHVLLTLAQQPAHSLVHLPRLAERLGSGVNTAELQSILETLSRPPFQALTPLPNGQYYLRSDVRDLLQEFGEYAEGMRRRIRPSALAATGR